MSVIQNNFIYTQSILINLPFHCYNFHSPPKLLFLVCLHLLSKNLRSFPSIFDWDAISQKRHGKRRAMDMTGKNSNNLGLVYNSLQQSQQENLDLNIVLL